MAVQAGGKTFKTKTTLKDYCKFVLNNSGVNTTLDGEWNDVLIDVLRMHEDFHEKTKGQEYQIGVRVCPINPRNKQFYILRADGTDTDFSYYKAISSKSKESYIKETLRAAIKDQTIEFKNNYFASNQDSKGYVLCMETSLKLKKKDSHLDHYPKQFDEIVKEWIDIMQLSSQDIVLVAPPDNGTAWFMQDEVLLKSFQDYHKEQAQYRVVLNKVNLQRKKSSKYSF